ncbi:hypothetical protein F5888DRAFT_1303708 [Russula emetica]|nr:hypothetical protein F5888DRAFT_1303708 [Russula emetica]
MSLITKSETLSESTPGHCTPISPSIRVCWVDLLVIFLILLVIVIFLFGVPLTDRLRKIIGGKRHDSSSSPRTIVSSSNHTSFQRGSSSRMLPRRQDSQETLLDDLVNMGDDKLDAIPLDPFLVVPPSFNDSLLVKQGLVEETTLPQPTHSAYDIQGSLSRVGRNSNTFKSSSRTSLGGGTDATSLPHGSISGDAPILSWIESGMVRDTKIGDSCETGRGGRGVPVPPAAHTPFSLGRGRCTV